VEEWLESDIGVKVNVKEAFKTNKDKMILAKIESLEQKNLTNEERETQKKLREVAREERDRGRYR
jgi:hypothetical protein